MKIHTCLSDLTRFLRELNCSTILIFFAYTDTVRTMHIIDNVQSNTITIRKRVTEHNNRAASEHNRHTIYNFHIGAITEKGYVV